jgi:hypothetical protein
MRLARLSIRSEQGKLGFVLASREIFAAAPTGFQFIERGSHLVKGKQESLEVYQLIGGPEGGASRATTTDRSCGS